MKDKFFNLVFLLAVMVGLISLMVLFVDIISDGYKYLTWDFFTNYASRKAEKSGILAPLAGTLWLISLTAILTIPVGISTALYLEEFATDNILDDIEDWWNNEGGYGNLCILVNFCRLKVKLLL